jgi:hypothetical protein
MLWKCSDCASASVAGAGHRSSASPSCYLRHPVLRPATHRRAPWSMSVERELCPCHKPAARGLRWPRTVSLRRASVTALRGKGPARFLLTVPPVRTHPLPKKETSNSTMTSRSLVSGSLILALDAHSFPGPIATDSHTLTRTGTEASTSCISQQAHVSNAFSDWRSIRAIKLRSLYACLGLGPCLNPSRQFVRFPKSASSAAKCAHESSSCCILLHTPDWPTILVDRFFH